MNFTRLLLCIGAASFLVGVVFPRRPTPLKAKTLPSAFFPYLKVALICLSPALVIFGIYGLAVVGETTGWFRLENYITMSDH